MGNKLNILKIVFVFLIVITALELVYYFYVFRKREPLPVSSDNNIQINYDADNNSPIDLKLVSAAFNRLVPRDLLKQFLLTFDLEGEITSINIPTPYVPKDKFEHVLRFEFTLKGKEGNTHLLRNSFDFFKQKSNIKVVDRNNEELNISDLKIGDKVNVRIEMDLTDSKEGTSIYNWLITKL